MCNRTNSGIKMEEFIWNVLPNPIHSVYFFMNLTYLRLYHSKARIVSQVSSQELEKKT